MFDDKFLTYSALILHQSSNMQPDLFSLGLSHNNWLDTEKQLLEITKSSSFQVLFKFIVSIEITKSSSFQVLFKFIVSNQMKEPVGIQSVLIQNSFLADNL